VVHHSTRDLRELRATLGAVVRPSGGSSVCC